LKFWDAVFLSCEKFVDVGLLKRVVVLLLIDDGAWYVHSPRAWMQLIAENF